jgi:hypothetical protein
LFVKRIVISHKEQQQLWVALGVVLFLREEVGQLVGAPRPNSTTLAGEEENLQGHTSSSFSDVEGGGQLVVARVLLLLLS